MAKQSAMEKELADAIDDYQVSVMSQWRVLVATVANVMERYGMDAVSKFEIPPGVLEKSNSRAESGLKIFNDWGEISRPAATILINRNRAWGSEKKDRGRKNKKR